MFHLSETQDIFWFDIHKCSIEALATLQCDSGTDVLYSS
jgi:hypothetical protein